MDKKNSKKSAVELLAEDLLAERKREKRLRRISFFFLVFGCLCSIGIAVILATITARGYYSIVSAVPGAGSAIENQPYTDPYANPNDPGLKYTKDVVKHVALYDFKITIPYDWTLKEINRRHDPMAAYDHDCAEYEMQSPDGKIQILLLPLCGPGGGDYDVCPDDAVEVSTSVYRYFSQLKQAYIYSNAMKGKAYSNTEQLLCSGIISLGEIPNHVWMDVEVRSRENISREIFSQVDTIILSLCK